MKALVLLTLVMGFISQPAFALIEARLHYGTLSSDPDDVSGAPKTDEFTAMGGDVLLNLPIVPLVFGIRYEQFSAEEESGNISIETTLQRTSAMVSFRPFELGLLVGIVGTLGLAHGGEIKIDYNGTPLKADIAVDTSYSLGVEAAFKIPVVGLMAGGEAGMLFLESDEDDVKQKYDGTYIKLVVGYEF